MGVDAHCEIYVAVPHQFLSDRRRHSCLCEIGAEGVPQRVKVQYSILAVTIGNSSDGEVPSQHFCRFSGPAAGPDSRRALIVSRTASSVLCDFVEVNREKRCHILMNTGLEKFGRPSVGSWVLYGLGSETKNLPGYVVLTSRSLVRGGGANWSNGFLPPKFQGVQFHNQGEPILNLSLPPGISRAAHRASLDALREANQLAFERKLDPEISSRIEAYELAFRMQSAAPELLDLGQETKHTIDAYGLDRNLLDRVVASADNKPREVSRTFSKNCLLARRMIERGVRFVTIFHGDWDHHHSLDSGLRQNSLGVDQPIAALLSDLKQRGLLDSTLVVIGGEFGRTPLGQGSDGRDHHPHAFTTLLAGGGVRGGTVIGKTDDFGWKPVEEPVHVHDLHATMLHLFGLDHLRLTHRHQGRDFRLTDVAGNVVTKLLG